MSRWSQHARSLLGYGALALFVSPLLWVIRMALRPQEEYLGAPSALGGSWTVSNFVTAFETGELAQALQNSLIVVVVGSILALTLASLAGWGLARYSFPGRRVLLGGVAAAIFVPPAALVMPLFEQSLGLGVVNSRIWVGVVYGTIFAPWATLFFRSYALGIPDEILEAALVDGAGPFSVFWRVGLPMAMPALAAIFVLNFFVQWSELVIGLILLPSNSQQTVTVAVAQFSTQFRTGGPLTAAGMLIVTVPVVLVFALGQRWLRPDVFSGGER